MRILNALGIAVAACLFSVSSLAADAQQKAAPIKVGAIFAVTGPASSLGAPEMRTAEMMVKKVNAAGGVLGREVQLIVKDSEGSPEKATSFAKQLIDEEKVLAIIGPSTSGESMAIKNICQEGKTILISCAAAEKIVDPAAPFVFNTAQKDCNAVRWIYQTMKERGIARIGVVVSNDGFGLAGRDQLVKYAAEYGITIASAETYDKAATDLTGVLNKIKGENVQAVVNWSIVPAQALVAKNMKQMGFDVPLYQSHGFANIKYAQAAGEAANGILFPAGRLMVANVLPDSNPQKKVLLGYKTDYETMYKEDASTFGGHVYDALTILFEAISKSGSTDPEPVRAAIENLHGLVGIGGIFSYSKTDHNGLRLDAFEMVTVKDGKFALYTK